MSQATRQVLMSLPRPVRGVLGTVFAVGWGIATVELFEKKGMVGATYLLGTMSLSGAGMTLDALLRHNPARPLSGPDRTETPEQSFR